MTKPLAVPLWVHGVGNGQIIVTSGLQNSGEEFLKRVVSAMCCFDPFTEDNDPNGEHDFGAISVSGDVRRKAVLEGRLL